MTGEQFEQLPDDIRMYVGHICDELTEAMKKHPHWPSSDLIHGAAIVGEESGELIRATLQREYEGGNLMEVEKEATQTGAMAIRFLINR